MAIEELKAGSTKGKDIERAYDLIQRTRKDSDKALLKLQCVCLHQRNRTPAIKRTNRTDAKGNPLWVCRRCSKDLLMAKLNLDEINAASALLSQCIDQIKILANPANDDDRETLKKLSKVQLRLSTIPQLYTAATKGNKKNKNKGQSSGRSNSRWT